MNNNNLNNHYQEIVQALQQPHHTRAAQQLVKSYLDSKKVTAANQLKIKSLLQQNNAVHELPLKWPQRAPFRKIVTSDLTVNPLELCMAFFQNGYLCFASALFWHGLTEQIYTSFFIATDRPSPRKHAKIKLDPATIKEEFMKTVSKTNKWCSYSGFSYYLIERDYSDFAGIIKKTLSFQGKKVPVLITNLERTLIDCAISPHYSGGLPSIVNAFEQAKLNIDNMILIYKRLNLIYPFWQRVGLYLEKSGKSAAAKKWQSSFGTPRLDFYLDKNYRLDWEFDENWKVYSPKGLFK
jgi:predicted transcriptional regulator of viral defense system